MQHNDKSGFISSVIGYNIAPSAMYSRKRTRLNVSMTVANLHGFYRDKTLTSCLLHFIRCQGSNYNSPHWKDRQRYVKIIRLKSLMFQPWSKKPIVNKIGWETGKESE